MKSKYLSNADFNFEKVNRASVACGPMVKWAIAQVRIDENFNPKGFIERERERGRKREF